MISSSLTILITMHKVKRFLEDALYARPPSSFRRARAAAEGNTCPEDLIPVYRRRTTINPSGREMTTSQRYYVMDSIDIVVTPCCSPPDAQARALSQRMHVAGADAV